MTGVAERAPPAGQARVEHAAPVAGPAAPLRARPIALDTYRENVILLSRHCASLRAERLSGLRKVEVRSAAATVLATPIICDDDAMVGPAEVGLPQPVLRRLRAASGDAVSVSPARPPHSMDFVRAKVAGETLPAAAYRQIAVDLSEHRWSDMEVAAFLMACAAFMTPEEVLSLTRGMIAAGNQLSWPRGPVVDKHCIGGIPGNRTSLIVTPIVAAHGLLMPKTSSRAITSPAGTADTMEVFARVDLTEDELRATVESCGACIAWGGRLRLSPADDVLVSVERPLAIDTPEQMVASILSKKVAAGSQHLVLDVPVGPTAKVRSRAAALRLKKLFEYVAAGVGLSIEVVLTDGRAPVGRGVGPVLEARDVSAVLARRPDAPRDLREKAIALAGRVLEADPDLPGGSGARRARELLDSGEAEAHMRRICEAQGASPVSNAPGGLVHEVTACRDGRIAALDCLRLARVARLAGAPMDPGAGVELLRDENDPVRRGEPIYRIYGSEPAEFGFAVEASDEDCGVKVA
ncbi:thymidine phosphorylase family protein [Phenylobacterium sp. J367]|uniref:thymidine phosphorylase family protein n=1 Tax=Phenylobacterium sp. J367 TaxID=2898435 RepID=UPI002150B4FE|nr:thymidine phosphorylase family protein [Phenylobacterium sp. J367]MCR5879285.1 thymidine phosphorylase family protein [Phenylobacterium sp. J367]